jgi:THO complex subunit 2
MSLLPSSNDASKALKGFSKSQEEWRNLILEVIELAIHKNDTSTDEIIKDACVLILKALNQYRRDVSDDEYSAAENIVVDTLWLKGALLEDSVRLPNPTNENDDEDKGHDGELEKSKMNYKSLCKLIKLLSSLTSSKDSESSNSADELIPIPVRRFQLSLEPPLLAASELLPNKSVDFFIKRMKKVNTEMFYRQKKVNLMQEESEGYSKYMRFLTTLPLMNDTHSGDNADGEEEADDKKYDLKEMKSRVSEYIGAFDLDPNRCLDLTLDVLEAQIREVIGSELADIYDSVRNAPAHFIAVKQLLCIIRLFPVEHISHLIGFKYTNIQDGTNKSLHVTTALLVQHELVSLDVLRPHLPSSNLVRLKYSEWEKNTKTRIRKLGVVSLNASKPDDDEQKRETVEKEENDETSDISSLLELFNTLLEIGMKWDNAISIFGENEKVTATNACLIYPKLGRTLCGLLERRVSNIYFANVENVGSDLIKTDSKLERISLHSLLLPKVSNTCEPLITSCSLVEVCEGMSDVFDAVVASGCVANHSIVFVKVCRLVKALLQKNMPGNGTVVQVDTTAPSVLSFLELFLVPSISYFPNNPAIASELWSVLELLPYQIRYALYGSSRKLGLEKAALRSMSRPLKPLFQIESEVNTSISTKFIFKRMSKENVKDMGRQLARVAHNNPMVVFTLMLNQIESYDNLIEMMVDSFKFMGILSLDVMGYCLLVSLGGEGEVRDKVKGKFEEFIIVKLTIFHSHHIT